MEKAENIKDIELVNLVYDNNAILYTPDLMPVCGKKEIASLYRFIFSNNNNNSFDHYHHDWTIKPKGSLQAVDIQLLQYM